VVLIHGLGLDWRMWESVMDNLSTGRRVFAYDIRSHGWAAGSPARFTMAETAADLVGVLNAVGVDRAHVVGLSYGGAIAQTAAVSHPERIESLALLATTDYSRSTPSRAGQGPVRSTAWPPQVVPTLTRWFTPAALAVNGPSVRYARERVLRDDAVDWAASWRAFTTLNVRDSLGARQPRRTRPADPGPGRQPRYVHDAGDHGRYR